MERSAVRKQLRRIHNLLVNSRWALEQSSGTVRNKWLKDLLFALSCRRVIMVNALDRELGILALPFKPGLEARKHLRKLTGSATAEVSPTVMAAYEADELELMRELEELLYQPGLSGSMRQMITELLISARENLEDVRFMKLSLPAA